MRTKKRTTTVVITLDDDQQKVVKPPGKARVLVSEVIVTINDLNLGTFTSVEVAGWNCRKDGSLVGEPNWVQLPAPDDVDSNDLKDWVRFATGQQEDRLHTWDCIHPCALLSLMYHSSLMCGESEDPEIERTIDSWGWADERGKPDYDKARREVKRWLGPKFVEETEENL